MTLLPKEWLGGAGKKGCNGRQKSPRAELANLGSKAMGLRIPTSLIYNYFIIWTRITGNVILDAKSNHKYCTDLSQDEMDQNSWLFRVTAAGNICWMKQLWIQFKNSDSTGKTASTRVSGRVTARQTTQSGTSYKQLHMQYVLLEVMLFFVFWKAADFSYLWKRWKRTARAQFWWVPAGKKHTISTSERIARWVPK